MHATVHQTIYLNKIVASKTQVEGARVRWRPPLTAAARPPVWQRAGARRLVFLEAMCVLIDFRW